jgi:hypothetical protein
MHIWLKTGAEEQLASLKEQGLLGDVRVETHRNSGKKYIVIEDAIDPASNVNVPEGLIERVTLKEIIYRGLRAEGIYRHRDATLRVKTGRSVDPGTVEDRIQREEWQEISVAAPNVEQLKTIYTLVRQKRLPPEENWDDSWNSLLSPAPATTDAAETV